MNRQTSKAIIAIICLTLASGFTIAAAHAQDNMENDSGTELNIELSLSKRNGTLFFSGTLSAAENEINISSREIKIVKIGSEENIETGRTTTEETGSFEISIESPKKNGLYKFIATNPGWNQHEEIKSDPVFYNSIDLTYISLIVLTIIGVALIVVIFFLKEKVEVPAFLPRFLLGVLLGWAIFQLIGLSFGIIIGGALIGYLLYQEFEDWKGKLSLGISGGIVGISALLAMNLFRLHTLPEIIEESNTYLFFSVSQSDFVSVFFQNNLQLGLIYIAFTIVGVFIGGSLKDIFSKRETLKEEDENN